MILVVCSSGGSSVDDPAGSSGSAALLYTRLYRRVYRLYSGVTVLVLQRPVQRLCSTAAQLLQRCYSTSATVLLHSTVYSATTACTAVLQY